ncbi:DNA-binding transcriptional regulator, LysR family [Streptoalloteichus tenebrarius]|uniref:DNA-binding transcriptional regulator, LysR family n=1 Tax=Streptoalloteichus tenebrarius (strain ATCC 17920 / DSM 40477 / JCM 4838 / CBS 697.72 / NBRC 16177 / NCIMB 11028 / NRRL B-12390 / A12253. 1 / ISP 5477) TaxID=1933 RepID=A0ABT1HUA5_STRSD|nr:LysR family transcriptional regulator [Streptoalloteichus tenebrarius]MCP2259072.1 DNA-binding transcriptional regulator, LysR family [Streptoalloteichus tenebrarius]BFE99602.1 LysR family transcriptional regulator [Streptoalloteichus tenebrarius]
MIELGRLRALHALASYGTVTEAARVLCCTPSAVSQQLAKLERETRSHLVERDGRRLRLTDAGRVLADHAERVLDAVERAEVALETAQGEVVGEITVASFATACRALFPTVLPALARRHPGLRVRLLEVDPYPALEDLARGGVDLVVVHDWRGMRLRWPAGVAWRRLGEDVVDLVTPADHPLAQRTAVSTAELSGLDWLAQPPGTICHDLLFSLVDDPVVRCYGEYELQLALVAAGVGVAMVPRLARPSLPAGVVAVPLEPAPAREVAVAWRESSAGRPSVRAVADEVARAWSLLPA